MGFPMMHQRQWSEPYVRTWHGDGTRIFQWHMWPMVLAAWLVFMMGVMVGSMRMMMMQRMMAGGMGSDMGMGGAGPNPWMMAKMRKKMMHHHHHGTGMSECCEQHGGAEEKKPEHEHAHA